jgi:hypothetical protein
MMKGLLTDLIYDKNRYNYDKTPNCVFIPKKSMVFSMLKACIGVTDIKDLWIYSK